MTTATTILQDLISIPSVNPDGGDPGTTALGEKACAEWVADFLKSLGADVRLEEVLPGRPNVIGTFPNATPGKPRILLAPHLDTVSVTGMTISPFDPKIEHGRIYGRGASDTKGTAAAMLEALRRLGPKVAHLGAEITFVGLMGEESAQYGSKHFVKHHPDYDFALVGEPTENKIVHTHKGCLWAELETRGKAVHGSMPENGINAITGMLPVVQWADTTLRQALADPEFRHHVLGDSTVNIGMIRGGSRANIVADFCKLTLDIRFTPGLHAQKLEAWLQEKMSQQPWAAEVNFHSLGTCAPLNTPAENPYVQQLAAVGNGLTGAPWFCDAAWLAAGGIPAVAAGPGSIAQAHTADEWLSLEDLEGGVRFYQAFLEGIG